jgi:type I restriction enzyme S subunit
MVDSKQTDIGSIPNAWTIYTLGEVSDIYRGGSPRPIEAFLTTNPDGINWIKIGDVSNNAKYIYTTKERIIPEGLSKSRYVKADEFW